MENIEVNHDFDFIKRESDYLYISGFKNLDILNFGTQNLKKDEGKYIYKFKIYPGVFKSDDAQLTDVFEMTQLKNPHNSNTKIHAPFIASLFEYFKINDIIYFVEIEGIYFQIQ